MVTLPNPMNTRRGEKCQMQSTALRQFQACPQNRWLEKPDVLVSTWTLALKRSRRSGFGWFSLPRKRQMPAVKAKGKD
jgi:hypothetical protein